MESSRILSRPIEHVDEMYAKAGFANSSSKDLKQLIDNVAREFRSSVANMLTQGEVAPSTKLPSLNVLKSEELRDGMLVSFRGMVQDMFESEIFLADYPSAPTDGASPAPTRLCGLFRDATPSQAGLDPLSGNCTLLDRQSLYCVPVPGESFWVKEFDSGAEKPTPQEVDSMQTETAAPAQAMKRPCEEENGGEAEIEEESSSPKKAKKDNVASEGSATSNSQQFQLNFPLANEKGPAVIVKVYESSLDLKVCDVCEFVGSVALDQPSPSASDSDAMEFTEMETETHLQSPPTSLVPRLHVIFADKICHNNPLLSPEIRRAVGARDQNENQDEKKNDATSNERDALIAKELAALKDVQSELTTMLKEVLLGDELAAQYLLCHLISSVHSRRDLRPIGKMTLNVSNCPTGLALGKRIAQVLEWLCPSVDHLPMSLPVLNGPPFVPVKDYDSNRLISSRLQLSKGTEILLDETMLSPGQLNEKGVRNLTILGTLIQWQKLDYDFKWTNQEFPTDLRLIVVSEGKSILPSDFQLHLKTENDVDADQYDAQLNQLVTSVPTSTWVRFRRFLSLVQASPYVVEDSVQKMVEEDFVNARAEAEANMTVEDFERLLLLARYVTLLASPTNGGRLSAETWQRCKRMEEERKSRIPAPRRDVGGPESATHRVGVEQ